MVRVIRPANVAHIVDYLNYLSPKGATFPAPISGKRGPSHHPEWTFESAKRIGGFADPQDQFEFPREPAHCCSERHAADPARAWAELFEQCLNVHGIYDWEQEWINVSRRNFTLDYYFAVKNWQPVSVTYPGTQYPYLETFAMAGAPEMVGGIGGDLLSTAGLPGQNTTTPSEKVFGNHQIVKYWWSDGSHSYFDLSYWTTYSGPDGFEASAVYAFGQPMVQNGMRLRRPPANAVGDIAFYPDSP